MHKTTNVFNQNQMELDNNKRILRCKNLEMQGVERVWEQKSGKGREEKQEK